jgi:hypothetical protein
VIVATAVMAILSVQLDLSEALRRWTAALRGRMEVTSERGKGFRLRARIPVGALS